MNAYMTLPNIQIGGHKYTVQLCNSASPGLEGFHGDSHANKMEIRVATQLQNGEPRAVSDVEQTLLHEVFHQINFVWKCDLDEENIERLSQGMLQVIHQFGIHLVFKNDNII